MHGNLAQICRWWLAKAILLQRLDTDIFHTFSSIPEPSSFISLYHPSYPYDLAPLQNSYSSPDNSRLSDPVINLNDTTLNVAPRMHFTNEDSNTLPLPSNPICDDFSVTQQSLRPKSVQQRIKPWCVHCPFIPGITPHHFESNIEGPSNPRKTYTGHLTPYGTPLHPIDSTRILRLCMQNTQFSFQLFNDGLDLSHILHHLPLLHVSMFVPISPNVIWNNPSNWTQTKQIFHPLSRQIHLSACSSNFGIGSEYLHKSLVGGNAILTFGQWATKVSHFFPDASGFGSFTVTTIQGKNNKKVSFISAYIAVNKGAYIGIDSLYAQQTTLHELTRIKQGKSPDPKFCPRKRCNCSP